MNKYQEAIESLKRIAYKQYEDVCYSNQSKGKAMQYEQELHNAAELLQELADKEQPKKLLQNYRGDYFCRNCLGLIWQNANEVNYCAFCGQKLDWSE